MPKFVYTGRCRQCGCSEDSLCTLPNGEPCSWYDAERTVCTAPACILALGREQGRMQAARDRRNKKKTPAEIHALILRKRRGKRGAA